MQWTVVLHWDCDGGILVCVSEASEAVLVKVCDASGVPPGDVLEMHILRLHPSPAESGVQGGSPAVWVLRASVYSDVRESVTAANLESFEGVRHLLFFFLIFF